MKYLVITVLSLLVMGLFYHTGFKDGYAKKTAQYNSAKVSAKLKAEKYKAKKKHEITRSADSDYNERLSRGLRDGPV